jgi:hypothetical protein
MERHEFGERDQGVGESPPPWLRWAIWLLVTGGVSWCWYATWQETVQAVSESNALDLGLGADPLVSKWLPPVAALASLLVAFGQNLTGRASFRFLASTGVLVVMKALTLGIEALLRQRG